MKELIKCVCIYIYIKLENLNYYNLILLKFIEM